MSKLNFVNELFCFTILLTRGQLSAKKKEAEIFYLNINLINLSFNMEMYVKNITLEPNCNAILKSKWVENKISLQIFSEINEGLC